MKKFILGISLFFGGIIGFIGLIISNAIIYTGMSGIGLIGRLSGIELLISALFAIMGLLGLLILFFESNKE